VKKTKRGITRFSCSIRVQSANRRQNGARFVERNGCQTVIGQGALQWAPTQDCSAASVTY